MDHQNHNSDFDIDSHFWDLECFPIQSSDPPADVVNEYDQGYTDYSITDTSTSWDDFQAQVDSSAMAGSTIGDAWGTGISDFIQPPALCTAPGIDLSSPPNLEKTHIDFLNVG
jgi:hypothetical protein